MKSLRVAMIAPPWLAIPPPGYGGIENVIDALVPALMERGVTVELFTVGDTTLSASKNHFLYQHGVYKQIHDPYYKTFPSVAAHILNALNYVKKDGRFDIIHDHNSYIGPAIMAGSYDPGLPPILHTLHGPPFDKPSKALSNQEMWRQIPYNPNFSFVGISNSHMKLVPPNIKRASLPVVYNAVDVTQFPYVEQKDDYFVTLARFHPDKGQAIAVRACMALGYRLKMAGLVADMTRPKQILMQLANPLSPYRSITDFRYFSDEIFPHLEEKQIEYVGDVQGATKMRLLGRARALLFPIQWEEPFGMAAIEAMACGTPVVAMNRGALPEIIKHGVNGFLAKNEKEFQAYMKRIGEIDPAACRASVEDKFSAGCMADSYISRYHTVISKQKKPS